ncbi:MAG: hypothetical protein FWE61_10360 [Micrococcales bacterium]|nr:hypothetical protein [Micrococcales bacterium]
MRVVDLDMVAQPDLHVTPEPDVLFWVSLPGIEAGCYTDGTGRIVYVETVPGTVPNKVLQVAQPGATYVVHPVLDGRFAVVLRTDSQARVVEVVADPVAPAGAYGHDAHPFAAVVGAWPGQVSPRALLASAGRTALEGLASVAQRLVDSTDRGQRASVRVQASYAHAGAVPSQLLVDDVVDGQSTSALFVNT